MVRDDDAGRKGDSRDDDADARAEHVYDATPPSAKWPVESTETLRPPGTYAAGANGGLSVTTPEGKEVNESRPKPRGKRLPRPK